MSDDSTLEVIEGGLSNCTESPCETVGVPSQPGTPETESDPRKPTHSLAARTLIKAAQLIDGDRNDQHGDRHESFESAALVWSWWLGIEVTKHDAAIMLQLLKISRIKTGEHNEDDYTDSAAYAALAGELKR